MKICDFCGYARLLTVDSPTRTVVICSRCVWASVEKLVEHTEMRHGVRCMPLDRVEAEPDAIARVS